MGSKKGQKVKQRILEQRWLVQRWVYLSSSQ